MRARDQKRTLAQLLQLWNRRSASGWPAGRLSLQAAARGRVCIALYIYIYVGLCILDIKNIYIYDMYIYIYNIPKKIK